MAETSPRSLSAADARLIETLYNALPDAVILLELSSGRILHWNNAATAIFGLPAEEAIDRKLDFIFADRESFQSFATDLASAMRNHGSWQTNQQVFRHDGARIDADIAATLVRPRRSHGDYVVLVFHERGRASATEAEPAVRLREIVTERTKFLQLLQEIAILANEASSIDTALEVTIEKICKETSFPCPETALLVGHVYRLITTDATPRVEYWYL